MQYGHCVVNATASAISSLYLLGIAPSARAALSKATNAFIASGALAAISFILLRFFMSYMYCLLEFHGICSAAYFSTVGQYSVWMESESGCFNLHSRPANISN